MAFVTSPRRVARLSIVAAVVGLAAGGAAWVLVHLIALITNLAFLHRVSWRLPSFTHIHRGPGIVVVAVVGGLVVGLMSKWAPVIRGHGIPEAMEAVLTRDSRISPRTALAKPLSAAIAIGTGGPFGAEGPIIVTGGALGSLVGQVLDVSPSERKILLACGAAGGMAATFGAPLASVVLAIELLLFEFSIRSLIPLLVAASVAGGVHAALFGSGPLFAVPAHHFSGLGSLPYFVPLGMACGLLAVVIVRGLSLLEDAYRRLPFDEMWWPAIGAAGFAIVGIAVPRVLGVGYDQITAVLAGHLALRLLVVLAVAKLVAWWVALASGTSGGTLAPILLISGSFGAAAGEVMHRALPGSHTSPAAFALVAMAATFGAATRAPLAAIVFVFELTRDYDAMLPLMLTTVVATLVALALTRDSILTEKLTRRGLRVPAGYHADVLHTTSAAEVMGPPDHDAFPNPAAVDGVPPSEPLVDVLAKMFDDDLDAVAVIEGGQLVGTCRRSDIVHARRRQFEHERLEPGWRWRRGTVRP
jgi:CIC family chloride channel protein